MSILKTIAYQMLTKGKKDRRASLISVHLFLLFEVDCEVNDQEWKNETETTI